MTGGPVRVSVLVIYPEPPLVAPLGINSVTAAETDVPFKPPLTFLVTAVFVVANNHRHRHRLDLLIRSQ